MAVVCFACSNELGLIPGTRLARSEECPHCSASLRSCKMCRFYDKSSYNQCKEPSAERVLDKEKANFCDYFALMGEAQEGGGEADSLVDAANALFKD